MDLNSKHNGYGAEVGVNVGTTGTQLASIVWIGIATDSSKSGIIVESDTDIKLIIKY